MNNYKCHIQIENLTYENDYSILFESASINIKFNKLIIAGKNGSGKSTLLRLIHIRKIKITNNEGIQLSTAFAAQDIALIENLSSLDNARIFKIDVENFKQLILTFNDNIDLTKNIKKLSGGQKQLINLCLCLSQKRDVYMLDEPLNNIDKKVKQKINEYLISTSKNLVIVTHEQLLLEEVVTFKINKRCFELC